MFFSSGFEFGQPSDEQPKGNKISLSLWPVSQNQIRSSVKSLSFSSLFEISNKLKKISLLAVFSPTPVNCDSLALQPSDFPIDEFKNSFNEDGFLHPINLNNEKGFCFILTGKESNCLSRARCISLIQVLNLRPIIGKKTFPVQNLFDLFPPLSQFSLRYSITPPPFFPSSFLPINPCPALLCCSQDTCTKLHWGKQDKLARWRDYLSQVTDNIFIGSQTTSQNEALLNHAGITHIVNCASQVIKSLPNFIHLDIPMFDGGNENILSHIFRITNFINDAIKEGGKVLLHCVEGVSRSAAVCIGYLIVTNEIDYKTAYDTVRSKRRISSPNPKFVAQLMQLAEIMGTSKTASCYFSKTKTIPFKVTERNDELVMLPIYSKIPEGDEENAYILLDYSNCKNGLPKNTDNENHAIITQYIGQKAPFEYKDCAQEFIESLKKCLNIEEIESIK